MTFNPPAGYKLLSQLAISDTVADPLSANDYVLGIRDLDTSPDNVLIPANALGGGVGIVDGAMICTTGCTTGGKAFAFYFPLTTPSIIIKPGFDITIATNSAALQINIWTQLPNTGLTGMTSVGNLSQAGGNFVLPNITSGARWISIFAKNPSKSNFYDGVCFTANNNVFTLLSF